MMKRVALEVVLFVGLLSFGINDARALPSPYVLDVYKILIHKTNKGVKFVVARSSGEAQPPSPDKSWATDATQSHRMFCRRGAFSTKDYYRGFVVKIAAEEWPDDTVYKTVEIDIGRRRSVDEGNCASLRMLSHLLRRYRSRSYYMVCWSVIYKGMTIPTATCYRKIGRERNNLFRDYIDEAEGLGLISLNETYEKDIHVVARKSGTFKDIRKRIEARR